MTFSLKNIDFSAVKYIQNQDGSISAMNLIVITVCTDLDVQYPSKFLQRDYLPEIVVPSSTPASGVEGSIISQAQDWIKSNYPSI